MSRLDDLIAERCPDGVPYLSIIETADYVRGLTYNKHDEQSDGPISVLRANNITLSSNTLNFDDVKRVKGSVRVRDNQRLRRGDILICAGSGSKDHIGKVAYISEDREETFGGFMGVVRSRGSIEPRYLFHILTGRSFTGYLGQALSTTTINNLNIGVMKGFRVPVPPLEVQREIVRILDTFSALEAELEAELEGRRIQYAHYRDWLLKSDEGSKKWATLGDIGRVAMCKRVFKHETTEVGEIPFYKIGTFGTKPDAFISRSLFEDYRTRYAYPKKGEILLSAAGTIGRAIPFDGAPAYFQDSNIVWLENDEREVTNRFLYHWYQVIEWSTDGGTIQRLYNENLRRAKILIPSLEEQHRIVSVLDQFESLTSDLSIGLPAELNARRKQYEYYRDKLLTFQELTT